MTGKQEGEPTVSDMRVRDLIEGVGAETPAPGGGAVASVAAALAAALLRMTSSYSVEMDEGPEHDEGRLDRIRQVSHRLLELAEEDRRAYEGYQDVRSDEQADESEEVEALVRSTEVPLEMHGCCVELVVHYSNFRDRIKTAFQADVDTAVSLLKVTLDTAEELVEYNIRELPDGPSREKLRQALASQKTELEELQATIDS
jgi:formiminotetrahydrofolate cyclodeaminase